MEVLSRSLLNNDDARTITGIYSNMGNYKGFGDTKFVPNMTVDSFERIVKTSAAFLERTDAMEHLWNEVKEPIFSLNERNKQLGLGSKGVTKYLSDNCTKEDADKINR